MKFIGLDPIFEQIPIRPVAHYSMGGVEADINGATKMTGIWAAGEVACHSLHGGNRLGTNSTAECLVYGGISGAEIVKYLQSDPELSELPMDQVDHEIQRLYVDYLQKDGKENFYEIREELRNLMDEHAGVYRTGESLQAGLDKIMVLKDRFKDIYISDKNYVYNTNLVNALETENLLDLAQILVTAAMARQESRGAHARTDFPVRDDDNWLKHTLVRYSEEGPKLDYKPVVTTKWKPVERKY